MRLGILYMKSKIAVFLLLATATVSVHAVTIAAWTFETSVPTTAGPLSPEVGSGIGMAVGLGNFTNPSGNGSAESWSANSWTIGDYWQFQVSTVGFFDIFVTFDQTSSATGPRDFKLAYSTDGSFFTDSQSYIVSNGSASWNTGSAVSASQYSFDLSAVVAVENATTVYFRLINTSTARADTTSTSPVATSGTDRVDNFTISGSPIPAPVPNTLPFGVTAVTLLGVLALTKCLHTEETALLLVDR